MEIPFLETQPVAVQAGFGIASFVIIILFLGWLLAKIGGAAKHGAYATRRGARTLRGKATSPAKKAIREEQEKEMKIDKHLRVSDKHLKKKTDFELRLINTKKRLWIGKDGERVHSNKAFQTAKRIADIVDDQVNMWKRIQGLGAETKGTRFQENNQELEKRLAQLQLYLLELAREIQEEVESEKQLVIESRRAKALLEQEAQGTRHDLMIEKKVMMEQKLHDSQTKEELKALQEELHAEFLKFREYELLAQSGLKFLDVNRVVFQKIREVGWLMLPLVRKYAHENRWSGPGRENAAQQAHNMAYYCKKIEDDIMGKAAMAKMTGKHAKKLRRLDKSKMHLTEKVLHS